MKSTLASSGLFQTTASAKRFFKASFEGFAGGGKTRTMGEVARGIFLREGGQSSVVIMDTEESSKFLVPLFQDVGLVEGETLFVTRSRSLVDYEKILKLCEDEGAILLIDTVTHLYEEMVKQYMLDNKRRRIEMRDYMVLKPYWKDHFSTPYVRAQCHALFTGRAAWEYEAERDEDTNKIKDFVRSGVKMRGDNETAFEPDFLVLMTRCQDVIDSGKRIRVWREATIMKSRYAPLDGAVFKNPTFADFEGAYNFVVTGKVNGHRELETPMAGTFADQSQSSYARRKEVEKLLGELKGLYDSYLPGSGAREKKLKADIAFVSFGKRSWEALEDLALDPLQQGYAVAEFLLSHLHEMPTETKDTVGWLETSKRQIAAGAPDGQADVEDYDPPPQDGDLPRDVAPQSTQAPEEVVAEGDIPEVSSEVTPEGQPLATEAQRAELRTLAEQIGNGAVRHLKDSEDHWHGKGMPVHVYEQMKQALKGQLARKQDARETA